YLGYTMGWTGRQLTSLSGNGITSGSFKYDANGLRSQKKINGLTTDYYYAGNKLLCEKRGTTEYHYQYDAFGRPCRISYQNSGGTTVGYYFTHNTRGDVEEIYNANGALQARYIYDAWGKTVSVQNASGTEISSQTHIAHINPFRYRGYYFDVETGLYYLGSRYYDPETGRFINSDGLIDNRGLNTQNLYQYCGNNPINNIDPSGHLFFIIVGVVALLAILALTGCSSNTTPSPLPDPTPLPIPLTQDQKVLVSTPYHRVASLCLVFGTMAIMGGNYINKNPLYI
ncbi:MAG: hypothetical protein FWG40_06600, partial [Peptococcaceae bacterium]|nr:hypothetical protein [Peptococcaceae bacterium]